MGRYLNSAVPSIQEWWVCLHQSKNTQWIRVIGSPMQSCLPLNVNSHKTALSCTVGWVNKIGGRGKERGVIMGGRSTKGSCGVKGKQ